MNLKTASLIQDILEKWLKIFLMTLFKDPETLIIKRKRKHPQIKFSGFNLMVLVLKKSKK